MNCVLRMKVKVMDDLKDSERPTSDKERDRMLSELASKVSVSCTIRGVSVSSHTLELLSLISCVQSTCVSSKSEEDGKLIADISKEVRTSKHLVKVKIIAKIFPYQS